MKRRNDSVYPRSVLASLKGDSLACLRYLHAQDEKTRRSRKRARELEVFVLSALREPSPENARIMGPRGDK